MNTDNAIPKNLWHTCQITGKKINDIHKEYGGKGGVYKMHTFMQYLQKEHGLTIEEYLEKHCNIKQPICPCGICKKKLTICRKGGGDFRWVKQKCGRYPGQKEWSEKAKITRKGANNPMYGKTPWNKGLTKDKCESLMNSSKKLSGKSVSEETKRKQSESAKKRKIHGHTGRKHSEESKEKMRQATLKRIKEGCFKHTKTACHLKMISILEQMGICAEEEKVVGPWCFDIYLPIYDIYIEVDGDYWHSNPIVYPNGPVSKTQKINNYRDKKKNKFCIDQNIKMYRFWESDILNNEEKIKCKVKKLLE